MPATFQVTVSAEVVFTSDDVGEVLARLTQEFKGQGFSSTQLASGGLAAWLDFVAADMRDGGDGIAGHPTFYGRVGVAAAADVPATKNRTPWQLARMAECADPDTIASPGARWLGRVEDAAAELFDEHRADLHEYFEWSDYVSEMADALVPTYTRDVWEVFTDLAAWNEDPSELGASLSNMESAAQVCLYMIAQRLLNALLDEMSEENDDAELTEAQAREIAGWWHDGQWSPLYAFASSGTTSCDRFTLADLTNEVRGCLPHADEDKAEAELASLLAYLEAQA